MSASANYRLVIADDHPLFRGALREAVTGLFDRAEIAEAGSFEDIAKLLDRYADTMGLAPESIRKALAWYKPVWTYDMVFTKQNYDNVNNVAKGIKSEKTYPYEEIVDSSFLKKASGAA